MYKLSIIGAGRLGKTLGRLAQLSGQCRIVDCVARSAASAEQAAGFIGAGRPLAGLRDLAAADLYLLSVPDAAIAAAASELAAQGLPKGALVFHASGAGELSLLLPLAEAGCRVGSLHPAFSFAEPTRAAQNFAGTLCALEGDAAALRELESFARLLGGRPFVLAAGGKARYHAALSVASNYLVAINDMALRLADSAGVPEALAGDLVNALMRQTLENAAALGPAAALTGPIVRGDAETVARHLAAMPDAELAAAYRALGRQTLALAGGRPGLAAARLCALLAED
ncbi:Rossmann-like and DUF2520 domain-containing protein [uncultured Aquitalea sp.]|uniref:Rossmann-like and DUF2520 domain-containing protein n=1 Tax=uncultured Aquitalea sp. TaxID=540272 RepID=UPI0025D51FB3|nr:Rossmann-like and DUF2520 domain-containing protein [uncultured Aquitalea sp.]